MQGTGGTLGFGGAPGLGGIPSIASVVNALALGERHSCALLATDNVRCWGEGALGALGYGNIENVGDDEAPSTAGDVTIGEPVISLVAGSAHTCALSPIGNVYCWGEALFGRLGYGDQSNRGDDETPIELGPVNVGGPVQSLSAAAAHTCAVLNDGRLRCWGDGSDFRLGYGTLESIGDDEVPAAAGDIDVGEPVWQVAAGGRHTCVLLRGGRVRCWGLGWYGALGYGNTNTVTSPGAVGDVDVGGPVAELVAGWMHTCALLESGGVRCWGYAGNGALGYGRKDNIGDDESPASAGNVPVGDRARQLATHALHTCALLVDGNVSCWGTGDQGQLGYGFRGSIGLYNTPKEFGTVSVGGDVDLIAAGEQHTCVISSGAVKCWGNGRYGKLGYSNNQDVGANQLPSEVGYVQVW